MTFDYSNKVVLITGSASGMGQKTLIDMAEMGAKVVITDIDQEKMDATLSLLKKKNADAIAVKCDVSKCSDIDNLIDTTMKKYGRIDVLINNAGLLLTGSIEETTDEIIDKTIDINIKGVLYAIRKVAPIMKDQKYGRIINVASITGKNGDNSTVFVYGASKGAVITITRSVARQLGPYGITCNGIAPHAVMTPMMEYWTEEKKQEISSKIPVRRLGTEEDMSNLMCYLSSEESGFVNGETININGGYYMD